MYSSNKQHFKYFFRKGIDIELFYSLDYLKNRLSYQLCVSNAEGCHDNYEAWVSDLTSPCLSFPICRQELQCVAHRTAEELNEIMYVQQIAQQMVNRRLLSNVSPLPSAY